MKIVILTATLQQGDAIGNDLFREYLILKKRSFDVYLYSENYDAFYASHVIKQGDLNNIISFRNNVLIYHHGIYWAQGQEIINNAKCKVLMKYHNITPPQFFEKYNDVYYNATKLGRQQTEQFVRSGKFNHYLADSEYNAMDIEEYGVPKERIKILAPFHLISDFSDARINDSLLRKLNDDKINVLFVGRVAPNKGHKHLIRVIKEYTRFYDRKIRLNIIGGLDPALNGYHKELAHLVDQHNLSELIHFKRKINFNDLYTYYSTSDIFLLMSEHEGFCMPILEAQYNKLPIVALDRCAVRGTLGDEQVIFSDLDYSSFAVAINTLVNDNRYREYIIKKGQENYLKYDNVLLADKFLDIIKEISIEGHNIKLLSDPVLPCAQITFRILLITLDHLGDFILSVPAIMRLREKIKNADIDLITGDWNVPLARRLNIFRNIFTYNYFKQKHSSDVVEEPKRNITQEDELVGRLENYDLAVDLRRYPDTRFLLCRIPASLKVGYNSFSADLNKQLDICLDIENDEDGIAKPHNYINMSVQLLNLIDSIPVESFKLPRLTDAQPIGKQVALFPCAGHTLKQWPIQNFVELSSKIIEGGIAERVNVYLSTAEDIFSSYFTLVPGVKIFSGLKFEELVDSLATNYFAVANNSFGSHIASYLSIPVFGIYSGQDTAVEWQPPIGKSTIIYSDIDCSPCHIRDVNKCPFGVICLKQITTEYVFALIKSQLNEITRRERKDYYHYLKKNLPKLDNR